MRKNELHSIPGFSLLRADLLDSGEHVSRSLASFSVSHPRSVSLVFFKTPSNSLFHFVSLKTSHR